MTQITPIQDLIAGLDLSLPWLLPTLETIELTVPSTVRLLLSVPLLIWFVVLRQRHAKGRPSATLAISGELRAG